jgi:hypothetical protein
VAQFAAWVVVPQIVRVVGIGTCDRIECPTVVRSVDVHGVHVSAEVLPYFNILTIVFPGFDEVI